MLLCKYCKGYSHADCYGGMDINIMHACGSCAIKENVDCADASVERFIEKPNKSQQGHSTFAFNLMLKQVMNSILKGEYKSTQPVAKFKEFERWFKFKPWFKYGWFHLKLYQMFQDLSQR